MNDKKKLQNAGVKQQKIKDSGKILYGEIVFGKHVTVSGRQIKVYNKAIALTLYKRINPPTSCSYNAAMKRIGGNEIVKCVC